MGLMKDLKEAVRPVLQFFEIEEEPYAERKEREGRHHSIPHAPEKERYTPPPRKREVFTLEEYNQMVIRQSYHREHFKPLRPIKGHDWRTGK